MFVNAYFCHWLTICPYSDKRTLVVLQPTGNKRSDWSYKGLVVVAMIVKEAL